MTPDPLVWPALPVAACLVLLLIRRLGATRAVLVALLKVLLPLGYLAGTRARWGIIDDETYFRSAATLLGRGYDPLSVFFSAQQFTDLLITSGGREFLYVWWNMLAQWLLGPQYEAAVWANVLLSGVAAAMLFDWVRWAGRDTDEAALVAVVFALHWETLSWTSFLNVKDTLVMVLAIAGVSAGARIAERITWRPAVVLLGVAFLSVWLRVYLVALIGAATLATMALKANRRQLVRLAFVGTGLSVVGLWFLKVAGLGALSSFRQYLSLGSIPFGLVHYLLSPQPWAIEAEYGFLTVAAVCTWLSLPLTTAGVVSLWYRVPRSRTAVIFLVVAMLLVAATPEVRGPRHRYMVTFVLAWAQVQAVLAAGRAVRRRQLNPVALPPSGTAAPRYL